MISDPREVGFFLCGSTDSVRIPSDAGPTVSNKKIQVCTLMRLQDVLHIQPFPTSLGQRRS
jgi:hypothetical protein